jgi:alkanesulfonate monooxygenase SsuD/methylene tetrahydromethanopterin reductase-like flavin-dependent oxidoreductase (luciferase family)
VLLGGIVRPALQRVGRIADGWITSSRTDLTRISTLMSVVRESAEAAGRDPAALRFICRGVVRAGDPVTGPDGQRLLLSGEYDQIRADAQWLGEQGVTEVFYDLNWDPQIGSPDALPAAATERAREIMHALAP